jgi:hypothetical protein
MPRTRIALTVSDWEMLTQSVTAETTAEAPHLEFIHGKLQVFLEEVRQLAVEQGVHEARKQAVTRRMNEILEEGRRTASALKVGLKQHLGNRNEELVKFGIQPLRARKRRKSAEPAPEGEGPPSSGEPSA